MLAAAPALCALVAALQVASYGGTRVWGPDQALDANAPSRPALTAGTASGSDFTNREPASDRSKQYNGRVFDPGTGFHDYGARMYWPQIGRFVSADSYQGDIANPASLNRYSYVQNNPYKYTDPTGHYVESFLDVAFIVFDVGSMAYPSITRDYGALAIDGAALGADLACLALPVATGGGLAVRAGGEGAHLLWSGSEAAGKAALKAEQAGAKVERAFTPEQQALVDMAKADKQKGSVTPEDMEAYKQLNAEAGPAGFEVPGAVRGPESHPPRTAKSPPGPGQEPHGHVGPVDHIPVKEKK